ncbi:carboxypeptidase B-like [Malaya genurostris]|uniref:carboxypeptidase B-like n=1 Tax=Malaya genurostris TaxID=325434 RepID=UPI0026F3A28E|nr:carboxypeptidase B-like [Malaya genurostris]
MCSVQSVMSVRTGRMKLWLSIVACVILALAEANGISYTEFQLYVLRPKTRDQLKELHELAKEIDLDFWDTPRVKRDVRVMVSFSDGSKFEQALDRHDFDYDYVVGNVQQILDKERKSNSEYYQRTKRDSNSRSTIDFNHYWELDEIYDYLDEMAAASPMVDVFEIGKTRQGRPIKAVTISPTGKVTLDRPVVFMDAGIHAREWVGHMSVMYMFHEFVEHPELYQEQLSKTDYVIIPVLNPDGYVYTHTANRLWRKNRVQNNLLCAGVDLNRNFPYAWAYTSNGCTNTFAGTEPASEPETKAMTELMDKYKSAMVTYIAVHTSGEMILWPWGYKFEHCANGEEHDTLGKKARDAIVSAGGREWEVGNSADVLYIASGATDDYAYHTGARLAYTIELTGGGLHGFDLPPSELEKAVREAFEIYKTFGANAGTLPLPTPSA